VANSPTSSSFRALLLRLGFNNSRLAQFWGFTPVYISRLLRRPSRPAYVGCAVRGLPSFHSIKSGSWLTTPASDLLAILDARGWSQTDVAAYWGFSRSYIGRLIADENRGRLASCAFLGLPNRSTVEVERSARYVRGRKASREMRLDEFLVVGDTYIAESDRWVPEGSIWNVVRLGEVSRDGVCDVDLLGSEGDTLNIDSKNLLDWFAHMPAAEGSIPSHPPSVEAAIKRAPRVRSRSRSDAEILEFLRRVRLGENLADLSRLHGFSAATFYRWKKSPQLAASDKQARLQELEAEMRALKG
jgi:Transposase